jgi:transposase-like protein
MQKEELHKKLDLLLSHPSKNILKDFQKELIKIVESLPECPRCGSTEVNRKGTNSTRKIGRVQQFVCKKCNHIYTHTSIERKKIQENYPKCPKCKSEVSRWGFWKWNGSKVQRFHCKMCGHYFRIERKRRIKKEDIRQTIAYTTKGTSVRMEALESPKKITGSGFSKKVNRIAKALAEINIFEIFQPELSPIICQDIVWCGDNWCNYIAKDPFTKVIIDILACRNKSYENAYKLESECIGNIGYIPKISITDGDVDFDQALRMSIHESDEYKGVRTIWLGRTPKEGGLTTWKEQHTYKISQIDKNLQVEKGIISPKQEFTVEDIRHHMTTIKTTLNLFNEYDAKLVCIMSPSKYIHFQPFITRFLKEIEFDAYAYHFVGTCSHGNPWAESLCKTIKKRHSWYYFMKKSLESDLKSVTLREKVRMVYYNLFLPQEQLGNQSPFKFANAKFKSYDDAWEILCSYL